MTSALFFLIVSAFLFSFLGTGMAVYALQRAEVMDTPSERSNHAVPTPRGGGIAVMFACLGFMLTSGAPVRLVMAGALLAIVSFLDDRRGLTPTARLLAQFLAVALSLGFLHGTLPIHGFGWYGVAGVTVLLWLWMINLTNFMDGIDGISVVEALSVCLGILTVGAITHDLPNALIVDSSILGAAMLGFGFWNWNPAKIFLGDVGSVPLGFLLGYLLLSLTATGHWQAALILPAYYLSDATFTLLRRALAGRVIWHAHSDHGYQKAVRSGRSHAAVASRVMALNAVLVALAAITSLYPKYGLTSLCVAYGLSFLLLGAFTVSRPRLA